MWIRAHKWRLLLIVITSLLLVSPISEIYNRQDDLITPPIALVFLAIIFATAERERTIWSLTSVTFVWFILSHTTEGSGLFAGPSLIAPLLFMVLLMAIFALLARWLVRATHVDTEVICAAICGYLLLGMLWLGLYATVEKMRVLLHHPSAFISSTASKVDLGDLLYFSYTTLTTTGYGDIIPRGREVRMLAVIEAMVGLFYNAIVIARFVSLYGLKNKTSDDYND
jgi:hypothetical protein